MITVSLSRPVLTLSIFALISGAFFLPLTTHASCAFITQRLSFNSSSDEVEILQSFLAQNPEIYPEGLVTGFFGPATLRAVQRFQIENAIVFGGTPFSTGFGVVGPRTRAFLNDSLCDSGLNTIPGTQLAPGIQLAPSSFFTPQLPVTTLVNEPVSAPVVVPQSVPAPIFSPQPAPAPTPAPLQTPLVTQPVQVTVPVVSAAPISQPPSFSSHTITSSHRFQQDVSFGGWGPHLGKMLRSSNGSLYVVDDTGNDITRNAGLAYYKFVGGQWIPIGVSTFFGTVQQNTGSVMKGDMIYTYGVDTENHRIEECYFSTVVDYKGCNHLPFEVDRNANYIGAALSPSGYQIVWWTVVGQNTGGTFEYIYNFGGGWNGPVSSGIGGFVDAGYVNIDFIDDNRFVLHAQLQTGFTPGTWKFVGVYADGSLGNTIPSWNMLPAINGVDPIISTNDVWVDSRGGAHILARSEAGAVAYFYRPLGGSFSPVLASFPSVYRARFIESSNGNLYMVYGKNADGLRVITIPVSGITGALSLSESDAQKISLPGGYASVDAIFPESSVYQTSPVRGFNVAINGRERQGELVHIELR